MADILYVAKNRLEFTKASFNALVSNTDWDLVDTLWVYDDGSVDGTREWLAEQWTRLARVRFVDTNLGAPAAIMNDYLSRDGAAVFAKIDNDVIVPPGWLSDCMRVMISRPMLDLLGIEPPESRTPHFAGGKRKDAPESHYAGFGLCAAPCDSIGGVGLMRRRPFLLNDQMQPHSIYGGFTEWQLMHRNVTKAWIVPPLKVFLLDRLPTEPWASLSREYISKGWQRAWTGYDPANPFWLWWEDARCTA